jgi:hypothetical protein
MCAAPRFRNACPVTLQIWLVEARIRRCLPDLWQCCGREAEGTRLCSAIASMSTAMWTLEPLRFLCPSKPARPPLSGVALAFIHGLLCDARKLTHVAYLRRDSMAPELIGVRRIASHTLLMSVLVQETRGVQIQRVALFGTGQLVETPMPESTETPQIGSRRIKTLKESREHRLAVGYIRAGLKPCLHPLIKCQRSTCTFRS